MKEPSEMTATERLKELSSLLAEALQRGMEKLEKKECCSGSLPFEEMTG